MEGQFPFRFDRLDSSLTFFHFQKPPYGDVDARVRAIAKNVFGLTTVIWNHDSVSLQILLVSMALINR